MRGPGSDDTPVAMRIPTAQAWVSKCDFQRKKVLGEITDSSIGTGKIQDDPRASCAQGSKNKLRNDGSMLKGHRPYLEGAFNGQS